MTKERITLGRRGEDLAAQHLKKKGYIILQRNYKLRSGEIDIVAKENNTISFVEVRTRSSLEFGSPFASVTTSKQRQIIRTALHYIKANNLFDYEVRFDVVSVLKNTKTNTARIELIKDAFSVDM